VQTKYPGVISDSELHSADNLRGIPKAINSEIHLSKIRKILNKFYKDNPDGLTIEKLLQKATEIDDEFGNMFDPPVR